MKNKKFLFISTILLLLLAVASKNVVKPVYANSSSLIAMIFGDGEVLGDDDEKEDDEQEEDEQEDDEQEEDEQEQDEQEDDEQEEDEQEQDHSSEEEIKNSNGSTTFIKRQSEDGKIEVELKTYSLDGKLLEERKLKSEDHEGDEGQELQLENYTYNSGDLKELKVKSKEGREIEVTVKERTNKNQPSKLEYKVNEQQLKIKLTDKRSLFITPKNDHLEIHDGVLGAQVELPLTVDPDNGEVFVETLIGLVRLGISPERAKEILEKSANFSYNQEDINLVEGGSGLQYKIASKKQEKLLWFIPVSVDAEYVVDAETGEFTGLDQSFWTRVLDSMSF